MSQECIVWAVLAPIVVCTILVPLVLSAAQRDLAAEINGQTLKAAAELKGPERLKDRASPRPFHASLTH